MHGSEGTVRIVACLALFAAGVTSAGAYGFALAAPPIFAVVISLRGQRDLVPPGPEAPYSELSGALVWLLVGSVLAQLLSYASVLGVQLLANESQKNLSSHFITGTLRRPRPAAPVPGSAGCAVARSSPRSASEGKHDDFRVGMQRLVAIVSALCITGTVAATLIGPWAGREVVRRASGISATGTCSCSPSPQPRSSSPSHWLRASSRSKAYKRERLRMDRRRARVRRNRRASGTISSCATSSASCIGGAAAAVVMAALLTLRMRSGAGTLAELVQVVEHEALEI